MKHTITGHVYWQQNKYMKAPKIRFNEYDMRTWGEDSRDGHVHVCEHSFEVEVPDDFDPRPGMIASLEQERTAVRAEFARRIAELDDRISKLQAIEYVQEPA
jgi:hypothetical protein